MESVTIADSAKDLQTSLALKRIILAFTKINNSPLEILIGDLIGDLGSVAVEHDKGQLMRTLFFVWIIGDILASNHASALDDLLNLSHVSFDQVLAEGVTEILQEVQSG